jgi:alcohol dehydrogenase class IV
MLQYLSRYGSNCAYRSASSSLHFTTRRFYEENWKIESTTKDVPHYKTLNPEKSRLIFPEQKVFAGQMNNILPSFMQEFNAVSQKSILIVTDPGVAKTNALIDLSKKLSEGFKIVVYDKTNSNPSCDDVRGIAETYLSKNCHATIALGGGGPMDAMKGAMAVVARAKTDKTFNPTKTRDFLIEELKPLLKSLPADFTASIPLMGAIPTTSGTGSEGGKSAVIIDTKDNKKFIFGHPIFFPKVVALIPNFTFSMPPVLTAATGVDALFHLLEAYFVTKTDAYNDGLNDVEMTRCDNFALIGTEIVAEWLLPCYNSPDNYKGRFYMQLASLFGAKAFRKGDLGAVHATAHSIGALYHLHHGTSIARMAVPVLEFNQSKANNELNSKLESPYQKQSAHFYMIS